MRALPLQRRRPGSWRRSYRNPERCYLLPYVQQLLLRGDHAGRHRALHGAHDCPQSPLLLTAHNPDAAPPQAAQTGSSAGRGAFVKAYTEPSTSG